MAFPALPTRPSAPTGTYTEDYSGGITATVAANQTIYRVSMDSLTEPYHGAFFIPPFGSPAVLLDIGLNPVTPYSTLNNQGLIWNFSDRYGATAVSQGHVRNSGTIIAESVISFGGSGTTDDTGRAFGVLGFASLDNSGSILAYATGTAKAVTAGSIALLETQDGRRSMTNSGTIAAWALPSVTPEAIGGAGGGAYTVELGQSATLTNTATGTIYAEGPIAFAVRFSRGNTFEGVSSLINYGLIESVATNSAYRSTGVYVSSINLFGEYFEMDNYGTIRADVAIYGGSESEDLSLTVLPQFNTEIIRNHAGALIDGDVILRRGDDAIYNQGTIQGHVDMGDGWDLFDNTGGTVQGVVDLGFGDDLYKGSDTSNDVVRGGLGNDQISGGAGADLLIGDGNDDALEGGAGNDGLYGGTGNDLLITQGGDIADGGKGDDVIFTEDYTFALIEGGDGYDVWVLPDGTRAFDLGLVVGSGRVTGIDELNLGSGKTFTVRAADIVSVSDVSWLAITEAAGSTIYLPEAWTMGSPLTVGGHTYNVYTRAGVTLVIDAAATVTPGAPPSPGGGLDTIAAGPAAALPGSLPGTALSNEVDTQNWGFAEDMVIDTDTIIHSGDGLFALRSFTLISSVTTVNNGVVHGEGVDQANGYAGIFGADLINNGLVYASTSGNGQARAVYGTHSANVVNAGDIVAESGSGAALGVVLEGVGAGPAPGSTSSATSRGATSSTSRPSPTAPSLRSRATSSRTARTAPSTSGAATWSSSTTPP